MAVPGSRTPAANSRIAGNRKRANQGKYSEGKMAEALRIFEDHFPDGRFHFERNPDARSAGGVFKEVTGDFHAWWEGRAYFIEVKEVDHGYRLPAKNFDAKSRGRLKRKALAGCRVGVFVYHTPTAQWRLCSIDMFFESELPSFDLSGIESSDKLIRLLKTFFQG